MLKLLCLNDAQVLTEHKAATCQARVDQGAEELQWVVKEGIPLFVRALLDSREFGVVNATLQTFAIQLGLHQACVDMKKKYPKELKDKSVLYFYLDAQRQIIDHFSELTTYKYSLLSALGDEGMDVGGMKKLLKVVGCSTEDEVGSC
ncbi:unnamed protein product [Lactuca saligna]|uniref:Uncharacterized protein n=1 Tax=Lactuca saligna TaxID=75948 RepID=A0AA35YEW8_LACSI|nr:unnamed protein product [Lactuca saligna]